MFFKIALLKNLAITVKKTPILECLFNKFPGLNACTLLKRDPNSGVFKNSFFRKTPHCSLYFCEILCDDRIVWTSLRTYFLCHCFDFLCGCFHIKILSKCKFRTHYYNVESSNILIESLKFRNKSRIAMSSPSNLL